jgi:hypothetical protein
VLAGVITGSSAFADSPVPPRSFKEITADGKYVFVMIAPGPVEQEASWLNKERAAAIREIRRVYFRSGLYPNDGSAEPLWTVDWYARRVELASDGIHLIRHGRWPSVPPDPPLSGIPIIGRWLSGLIHRNAPLGSALDQEALSFFANGQLLHTYRIGELVDAPDLLRRTVSHFDWEDEGRFDENRLEYMLTTLDGNRFVFDLRTGGIVTQSRRGRPIWWGWWAILGVAGIGAVVWIARRRRAKTSARGSA